ncbi:long-chain fatty acid--CoA ligase [Piscinibacter sakaiensis]|uniref:long-chain fatty acid--CoA ligase n=1 Tax=Piscinibacter sakaiensis TaxID=1547922 RepID=UPI003AAF8E44
MNASLRHRASWPPGLPLHLTLPQTSLSHNLEVSAARYPDKAAIRFYGNSTSYRELLAQTEAIAGFLQSQCGVAAGDRVLLYMQNSPQWVAAYYGILRANAVVVPVNPMNLGEELRHYVADSGATTAFAAQDLADHMLPLLNEAGGLRHLIVATYSDGLQQAPAGLPVPAFVAEPRRHVDKPGVTAWREVLAAGHPPPAPSVGPDSLCVMPYTSGTTGRPKGCKHTHRTAMSTLVGGALWFGRTQDAVFLSALPFFHVTGMSGGMNGPIYLGATIVILPRWDREAAAWCIAHERVTVWQLISTMMIDFLANPRLADVDLSSLQVLRGGGAAMPAAIVARLKALTGLDYCEGYGMSETLAATHINPGHRPKPQCLGIPVFDVDARIVDPLSLQQLPDGEVGEIVIDAPQVMLGYWNNDAANAETFIEIDGRRFLRTGDLARIDEDGYFFMVDRLKRMINASGYKVWPAEVEAIMYHHPAIREACVIAAHDERRGETVKALVVLDPASVGQIAEGDIITWARSQMAAYKCPRFVEFVDRLPKSASGKVLWRELQAAEAARALPGTATTEQPPKEKK